MARLQQEIETLKAERAPCDDGKVKTLKESSSPLELGAPTVYMVKGFLED